MPAYLSCVGLSLEVLRHGVMIAALRVLRGCLAFCFGFLTIFVVLGASPPRSARAAAWRVEVFGFEIGAAQVAGVDHRDGAPLRFADPRSGSAPRGYRGAQRAGAYPWAPPAFGWSPCVAPSWAGS
jgi:hypothetical protein